MTRNVRLTVEYDGGRFHGWQVQPRVRTVQGELEGALATILRHPVRLSAAGRTDQGVHALGQVVNFETAAALGLERIRRGANALTGPDMLVSEADEVPGDFHARFSARSRHYAYLLLERPSVFWNARGVALPRFPEAAPMNAALAHLLGDHDFAAFSCRGDDEQSTRSEVLYARWEPWERGLVLRIGAVRFLYRMVRCIVASCLDVAYGRQAPETFRERLTQPAGRATRVAPARGLTMVAVDYDDQALGRRGADCLPPGPVL
jgi:tRNA pseudouridine38-40 synthase